jgi:hypothetical protein
MALAKRIETTVERVQGDPSQIGADSSSPGLTHLTQTTPCDRPMWPAHTPPRLRAQRVKGGSAVRRTPPHRPRRALAIAALICLMLVLLPTSAGVAFAQERTGEEERFVEGVVSNLNAYWEEQFRLLGYPYSPAKLVFIHDGLLDSPCGLLFAEQGPGYCAYDETLYYPVGWLLDGQTLDNYGDSAVEWAVAHEIAHHAQVQMDKLGMQGVDVTPGVEVELEADCLAGVYANKAITPPGDLESALAAIGESGGPGHGTSQQRIAAFELGYSTGDPAQCLALGDGGGTTTTDGGNSGMGGGG